MNYNFLTNIQSCHTEVPGILYYSHIPTAIIILVLAIFLLFKNKENRLASNLLFLISIVFLVWVIFDLTLWLTYSSTIMMIIWSFFPILYVFIHILGLYFIYVTLENKDISNKIKCIYFILFLPVAYLTATKYNLVSFDIPNCQPIEGHYLIILQYAIGILLIIWSLFLLYIKQRLLPKENKKRIIYICIGTLLFLITLSWSEIISSMTTDFTFTQYGLFCSPIFAGFLVYSIVRFKAFNIKLLGAQALMWTIGLLVGAQLFFIKTTTNYILTSITLLIVVGAGILLVKSVKKVDEQRELLAIANNNQESLIHFISHQLKGFLTKSKMIFAGIIEGDFGEQTPMTVEMAKTGLASDDNAVDTIQNILGASNLKTGITSYNFERTELNKLIKKAASAITGEIEKRGLKLELDISSEPIVAMVDETQISQVFKNLMDNSMRYTPTGEIKVSLKINPEDRNKVLFTVKDTGVGLSESDKIKLFTEGGKGEESLKINTNSTGYGLYIVRKIVEGHQGRIWAESAGRGHGSTFNVELNLAK